MARARDSPTRARKARERTSTRGRKKESTKMLEQKVRPKGKGTFCRPVLFLRRMETLRTKGGSKGTGSAWSVEVDEDNLVHLRVMARALLGGCSAIWS